MYFSLCLFINFPNYYYRLYIHLYFFILKKESQGNILQGNYVSQLRLVCCLTSTCQCCSISVVCLAGGFSGWWHRQETQWGSAVRTWASCWGWWGHSLSEFNVNQESHLTLVEGRKQGHGGGTDMSLYKFIRLVEVQVNVKANDSKEMETWRHGKYYSYGFLWSNERLPL